MGWEVSATSSYAGSEYAKIVAVHQQSMRQQSVKAQEAAARFRDVLGKLSTQGGIPLNSALGNSRTDEFVGEEKIGRQETVPERTGRTEAGPATAREIRKNLAAGGIRQAGALPSRYQVRAILQRG